MANADLLATIQTLHQQFDLNDIEDYRALLPLIQHICFSGESEEKYALYNLITTIIQGLTTISPAPTGLQPSDIKNYLVAERVR